MVSLRELLRRTPRPTVFVLSGGGNLGAVQVGMLRALFEQGIRPDLVLGCSVGALNGAAVAAEPGLAGVARLEELWRSLESNQLMPHGWLPQAVHLARRGESVADNAGLRQLIAETLRERFEDLRVPFQCVATDVLAAEEHWFTSGPLHEPVLASAALPAIYPSVEIDGVRYLDGAIVNDVPISRAVELGAGTVYVLHVGHFDRPRPEPKRPIDVAVHAYWIARHHRFKRDLAAMPPDVELVLLPTGAAPAPRFSDFTRSGELINHAYEASRHLLRRRSGELPADADLDVPEWVSGRP